MTDFYKLKNEGDSYFVTYQDSFHIDGTLKKEYIEKCKKFAHKKADDKTTMHRRTRSGGTKIRCANEIFKSAYEGKLAEYAFYDFLNKHGIPIEEPNMDVYQSGSWDDSDFEINGKSISIKSTKQNGQLLLMETKDFSKYGMYIPNKKIYDIYVMVRISGDKYNIAGWINHNDFKSIIRRKFILEKGNKLNGKICMDASNYYVQIRDMRRKKELLEYLRHSIKKAK